MTMEHGVPITVNLETETGTETILTANPTSYKRVGSGGKFYTVQGIIDQYGLYTTINITENTT